jgi:hypothetical protein
MYRHKEQKNKYGEKYIRPDRKQINRKDGEKKQYTYEGLRRNEGIGEDGAREANLFKILFY